MDITPLIREGQQVIQSYGGGGFKVNGTTYDGAAIVFVDRTEKWDVQGAAADLQEADFKPLLDEAEQLDVVLLGCGAEMDFLPAALKNSLQDKGVAVETMDTGAACRTYNVLMAEGRRVAAALLPV